MNGDFREDLKRACEVMQKGGVILYPTDTIWGIGCDATNPEAVKRVYDIKKRADSCLLYTSPSPRDTERSRMPSSA